MRKIVELELAFLARFIISRFRPFVIGVTGSSGKTTTKYFIGELLKSTGRSVRVSPGNLNTKTGLPLSILGFQNAPQNNFIWFLVALYSPIKALLTFRYEKYLVLEYAIDLPGDMEKLIDICPCDIVVITNLGSAHIEIFKSEKAIAQEKWKLAEAARVAVITNRLVTEKVDSESELKAELYILPSIKFAKAENINILTNRTEFDFYLSNTKKEAQFHFFGRHNVENLEMAAFAAYLATGEGKKILDSIKNLQPLSGRGRRIYIKALDLLLIDESYNANPSSMTAALKTLEGIKQDRRVAILGEMAEIGPIAKEAHKQIAALAKQAADLTVGVGEAFKELELDIWYENVTELNKNITEIIKKGDAVLIKGSRLNELDQTVKILEEL